MAPLQFDMTYLIHLSKTIFLLCVLFLTFSKARGGVCYMCICVCDCDSPSLPKSHIQGPTPWFASVRRVYNTCINHTNFIFIFSLIKRGVQVGLLL